MLNSQEIERSLHQHSVGVSRIVEFLSAKAAGCVMLSISTSEHNGCSEFLRGLNLADFDALENLIITTSSNIPSDREASYAFTGDSRKFVGLTTIALVDLGPNVAPSIGELHAILTVATALERLSFEEVQSNAEGLDAVALPKLSSLCYKPLNNADLGDLMALLRNPRLQQLSVVIMSEDDINILIECSDSLANAHSLAVDGFHFDKTNIQQFYRTIGTVNVLDVSTAVREFCTAIIPRSAFWQGVEKAHFRDARDADLERLVHPGVRTTRLKYLGVQFTRYNLLSGDTEQFPHRRLLNFIKPFEICETPCQFAQRHRHQCSPITTFYRRFSREPISKEKMPYESTWNLQSPERRAGKTEKIRKRQCYLHEYASTKSRGNNSNTWADGFRTAFVCIPGQPQKTLKSRALYRPGDEHVQLQRVGSFVTVHEGQVKSEESGNNAAGDSKREPNVVPAQPVRTKGMFHEPVQGAIA
ncbi:hypothetical protein K438DRAFT_1764871 [Mycena galopus ATCC 62051]|nr:hypothetical protein K438DRAFT_1764871 [Mycena galopus ATCC 62051]